MPDDDLFARPNAWYTFNVVARVVVVGFEDMQALDLIGPLDVFSAASVVVGRPVYQPIAATIGGGERRISCGIAVRTRDLRRIQPRHGDTVIVVGGPAVAVANALVEPELVGWLRSALPVASRMASVCTGAFVLAAAGLLNRKRVVTHWSDCELLAQLFPDLTVDRNAIYAHEGAVWTSAGASAGIDMALAMVEEDHGRSIADKVATRLVLYMRRPGYQSQLSEALVAQATTSDPLGPAIAWARTNIANADIAALAHRAGLSLRTLHRHCLQMLSTTPGKLLSKLRVEHARTLLATTKLSAKSVAAQCGFGNSTRMNRAFEREVGVTPQAYRHLAYRTVNAGLTRFDPDQDFVANLP